MAVEKMAWRLGSTGRLWRPMTFRTTTEQNMSLFADILRGEWINEDEAVRQDGDTWTVCIWVCDEEIPGFPSKEMALAVCRALRNRIRPTRGLSALLLRTRN